MLGETSEIKPAVVCIIVPVLWRPQNVRPTMDSVAAATTLPHRLLFVASERDPEEVAELDRQGADYLVIDEPGTWARKINLGARSSTEEWVFTGADDLLYHEGWLEAALTVARATGAKVIGTNDLGNPRVMSGDHSTHTLVHRSYIEDPGGVIDGGPGSFICEMYPHEYADDELVQTSQSRHVFAHAPDSIVEHLHYLWGKGEDDRTYMLGRKYTTKGRLIFRQRRRMWVQ